MVMGGDSCAKCHGFEIRHHILDGHFFTLICCKNCIVCFNRPKINEKRPGLAHFLKKVKKRAVIRRILTQIIRVEGILADQVDLYQSIDVNVSHLFDIF